MRERPIDVTIVISAYRLERYLPECLDGLLKQTYASFEVLLIDDASPDATGEIARSYQSRMPGRLTVWSLDENTCMAAHVRNLALDSDAIHGEYILFWDGDDTAEPDCIARLIVAARRESADIVVCAYDRLYADGRRSRPEPSWLANGRGICPEAGDLAFLNTALWNKLIRRDIIGDIRMPALRVGEDALFLWALYSKCERFSVDAKPLLHYRVRQSSAMSRADMRDITYLGDAFADLYEKPCAPNIRRSIATSAFIHIGLSMALRVAENHAVSIREFTAWERSLFRTRFNDFRGADMLGAATLFKRGRAGVAIWLAKWLYRLGLTPALLRVMRLFRGRANTWARW